MRKFVTTLSIATVLLVMSGCGTTNDKKTESKTTASTIESVTTEAEIKVVNETASNLPDPKTADPIVVYLNDFDAVIGDLFYEETGYKVEVFVGNGAEIASRIEAEGDNPLWDVVWMDSMPSMYAMGANGQMLADWTPSNADNLTDFYSDIVPESKWYYPTGAHSAGLIVYNNEVYTEETAPKSFDDLLDNSNNYKIGMANPGVAAPAYPLAAWFFDEKSTDGSLDGGIEYFEQLLDQGMKVYPKNPQIVEGLAGGEVDVAILQESNAYSMLNSGESISIVWPDDGAPASVRVAGISSQSDNIEIAKLFIEFLLEADTQQALVDLGDEGYFSPSVVGANSNEQRTEDITSLVYADAAWAAEHEAEIKAWFADNVE